MGAHTYTLSSVLDLRVKGQKVKGRICSLLFELQSQLEHINL